MVVERSLEVLSDALGFDVVELWENRGELAQQHRCLFVQVKVEIQRSYPGVPIEPFAAYSNTGLLLR
jgi:hypothetical protein